MKHPRNEDTSSLEFYDKKLKNNDDTLETLLELLNNDPQRAFEKTQEELDNVSEHENQFYKCKLNYVMAKVLFQLNYFEHSSSTYIANISQLLTLLADENFHSLSNSILVDFIINLAGLCETFSFLKEDNNQEIQESLSAFLDEIFTLEHQTIIALNLVDDFCNIACLTQKFQFLPVEDRINYLNYIKEFPIPPQFIIKIAEAYIEQKEYPEALDILKKMSQLTSGSQKNMFTVLQGDFYYLQGVCFYAFAEHQAAFDSFSKAQDFYNNNTDWDLFNIFYLYAASQALEKKENNSYFTLIKEKIFKFIKENGVEEGELYLNSIFSEVMPQDDQFAELHERLKTVVSQMNNKPVTFSYRNNNIAGPIFSLPQDQALRAVANNTVRYDESGSDFSFDYGSMFSGL